MKQLMVISNDTYAAGLTPATATHDDVASLTVGAYAIINRDPESANKNHVVDVGAASEAATPAIFQIVTMTANGLKWSPYITLKNCRIKAQAYVAPQAKVMNIAWTASGLEANQVAGFIVTDTTKGAHELNRNRSYVRTVTASDTEATIIAALIVLANADANGIVTASAGTNIVLTRDTAGKNFEVSTVGILRGATITISTAHITGTGTGAQLLEYEKECNPERGGNTGVRQDTNVMNPIVSEVSSTGTYDLCQISFETTPSLRPLIKDRNPVLELVMAFLVSLSNSGTNTSKEAIDNFVIDINV